MREEISNALGRIYLLQLIVNGFLKTTFFTAKEEKDIPYYTKQVIMVVKIEILLKIGEGNMDHKSRDHNTYKFNAIYIYTQNHYILLKIHN